MPDKKMKELEQLCRPIANYLRNNWGPYCTVVISDSHIKLVRDEIGIPLRTAQEVPVQEQLVKEIVKKELKAFKLVQIIVNILVISTIMLQIVVFTKQNIFLNDAQTQINMIKESLMRFK